MAGEGEIDRMVTFWEVEDTPLAFLVCLAHAGSTALSLDLFMVLQFCSDTLYSPSPSLPRHFLLPMPVPVAFYSGSILFCSALLLLPLVVLLFLASSVECDIAKVHLFNIEPTPPQHPLWGRFKPLFLQQAFFKRQKRRFWDVCVCV